MSSDERTVVISGARLFPTAGPSVPDAPHTLTIAGSRIAAVAEGSLEPECDELIRANGRLLMPGWINTHTHLYGAFARGLALPGAAPENFVEILEGLWWKIDRALDLEDIAAGAAALLVEAVMAGCTSLFDHHASHTQVLGSLDVLAEEIRRAGIRGCLSYELSDRDGREVADLAIEENVRFISRCRDERPEDLSGLFGLHAGFTIGEPTLERAVEAAQGSGFHLHLAEDAEDVRRSRSELGLGLVERFRRAGVLSEATVAAHGVHLDEDELDVLAETGVWLAHNPESNQNNAVGMAAVEDMLDRGVNVVLGTDGCTHRMADSARSAYFGAKHREQRSGALAPDRLQQIAIDAPNVLAGRSFGIRLGAFEPGFAADLVLVDYDPPTPLSAANAGGHLVFGISDAPVRMTMAAGEILYLDGELRRVSPSAIMNRSRQRANDVWRRLSR